MKEVSHFFDKYKFIDVSEQVIKYLRKNREKFVDRIFVPTLNSLVNSIRTNTKQEWANY